MIEAKCQRKGCDKTFIRTGTRKYCGDQRVKGTCSFIEKSKKVKSYERNRTKPKADIKPPTLSRKEEEGLSPHQKHKLFVQQHNAQVERAIRERRRKKLLENNGSESS